MTRLFIISKGTVILACSYTYNNCLVSVNFFRTETFMCSIT